MAKTLTPGPKAVSSCKNNQTNILMETLRSAAACLALRGWEGALPGRMLSGLMLALCYRYHHGCVELWGDLSPWGPATPHQSCSWGTGAVTSGMDMLSCSMEPGGSSPRGPHSACPGR